MSPDVLRRKLTKLTSYLKELRAIENYSYQEYLDNFFIYRTTERILQLLVDVSVDINSHILIVNGEEPPVDYYSSFIEIANLGVIPMDFAKEIAPSTGLRNRIVHEYDDIKDELVYKSVKKALDLYKTYMKYIEEYLTSL